MLWDPMFHAWFPAYWIRVTSSMCWAVCMRSAFETFLCCWYSDIDRSVFALDFLERRYVLRLLHMYSISVRYGMALSCYTHGHQLHTFHLNWEDTCLQHLKLTKCSSKSNHFGMLMQRWFFLFPWAGFGLTFWYGCNATFFSTQSVLVSVGLWSTEISSSHPWSPGIAGIQLIFNDSVTRNRFSSNINRCACNSPDVILFRAGDWDCLTQ